METECDKCGKEIDYIDGKTMDDNTTLCFDCYGKSEAGKIENIKSEGIKIIRDVVDKTDLSIPELQLQELREMKTDLKTLKNVILIWFIIGLIGFLISIATYMYFTGSL